MLCQYLYEYELTPYEAQEFIWSHFVSTCLVIANAFGIPPKIITSFLNIKTASVPIQNAAARVKYWIKVEKAVQMMVYQFQSKT